MRLLALSCSHCAPPLWVYRQKHRKAQGLELSGIIHKPTDRRHLKIQFVRDRLDGGELDAVCLRNLRNGGSFHVHHVGAPTRCQAARFSADPLTDETVTTVPSPPSAANRSPESASTTSRARITSPTFSASVSAPAIPADTNTLGEYFATTLPLLAVPPSRPIPPTAITAFAARKTLLRPLLGRDPTQQWRHFPPHRHDNRDWLMGHSHSPETTQPLAATRRPPDRDSIPRSRSALALVTNIFLRPMRTESRVTRGSRPRILPVTRVSTTPVAYATA